MIVSKKNVMLNKVSDIFHLLYKKRKVPETFLSILFASCLEANRKLLQAFLTEIVEVEIADPQCLKIKMSHSEGDSCYDMLITDNSLIYVVVEFKLTAPVDLVQLAKYSDNLERESIPNKALCLISRNKEVEFSSNKVPFISFNWIQVVNLVKKNSVDEDSISNFLTQGLIKLLFELQLDSEGRKLWVCEICQIKTSGYGVYQHQQSHRRTQPTSEEKLKIEMELRESLAEFKAAYDEVKDTMEELEREVCNQPKIERKNFSDIDALDALINCRLPCEWILYFIYRIRPHFSNSVFFEYEKKCRQKLKQHDVKSYESPYGYPLDPVIYNFAYSGSGMQ